MESLLIEMLIKGEGVTNTEAAHEKEAHAIYKAEIPALRAEHAGTASRRKPVRSAG